MAGQHGGVPDPANQPAHLADAARQRHAGLLTDCAQDVLPGGGRAAHRAAGGGTPHPGGLERKNYLRKVK